MSENPNHDELLMRCLEGIAGPDEMKALSRTLRESPETMQIYTRMLQQHLQLHELAQEQNVASTMATAPSPPSAWKRWDLAVAALLMLLLALQLFRNPDAQAPGFPVEILEVHNLKVTQGPTALTPQENANLDRLVLAQGMLRFRPCDGATVTLNAPADLEMIGATQLHLHQGQITAQIEPSAQGFTVYTSQARVVDLGTCFGVAVHDSGNADVVVFDGTVEVHDPLSDQRVPIMNLNEGEAIRIDAQGELQRLSSVQSGPKPTQWSSTGAGAVISSVTDNVSERWSYRFYPILPGQMAEGVRAWPYEHNQPRWWSADGRGLPEALAGADLVQILQQELDNQSLVVEVTLAQPALLFVFHEAKAPLPAWLTEDFERTALTLRLSPDPPHTQKRGTYEVPFEVWQREIPREGTVTLGPVNKADVNSPPFYMYGVAAKALK